MADPFYRRPLIPLTLAHALGILAGWSAPGLFPAALGVFFLAGAACLWAVRKNASPRFAPLVLLLAAGVLAIHPLAAPGIPQNHVSRFIGETTQRISGRVAELPAQAPDRTRLLLLVDTLGDGPHAFAVTGKISVTARPPLRELRPGDKVAFTGRLRPLRNFQNPGAFDYEGYMRRRGIFASSYAGGRRGRVEVMKNSRPGLLTRFRDRVGRGIEENARGPGRGILKALILGQRDAVNPEFREEFIRSGTAHILAISGLHVGMVAALFYFLFYRLLLLWPGLAASGRARQWAGVLAILPAAFYAAAAGFSPSAERALLMVAAAMLALAVSRRAEAMNTLALAGLVILLIRPQALFSASFQLSFAAVIFIVLAVRATPGLWKKEPGRPIVRRLSGRAAGLLVISLAAALGTAPLVMHDFYRLSLVGPLTNLLAVPLTGLWVLPLGLAGAFLSPVLPGLSGILFFLAGQGADILTHITGFFAHVPMAEVLPFWPNLFETALLYALPLSLYSFRKSPAARKVFAAALVLALMDAAFWVNDRYFHPGLRVSFLDVGHGSAAIVRFPKGPVMVVDAGGFSGTSTFDTGERIVGPWLWQHKIHSVDWLAATHPQQDHCGGLPFLARRFSVGKLLTNGRKSNLPANRRLLCQCRENRVPTLSGPEPGRLFSANGVDVTLLHPLPPGLENPDGDTDPNRDSLVIRLTMGRRSLLLCGDIPAGAEREIQERAGKDVLRSDLVLVPHHGSGTSSCVEFVDAVRPEVAVISAGWNNPHGLPDPEVVQRYEKAGARVFNTGTHGAVSAETDGEALSIQTYNGKRKSWKR